MDSNSEKKKMSVALKLTIIFICVAAFLTFFSRTMYNAGVPTVHIGPVKSEKVRIVYEGDGIIEPREIVGVFAPGDLVVTEVLVKLNDVVKGPKVTVGGEGEDADGTEGTVETALTVIKGDVLARFDLSGLENQLADMKTQLAKLIVTRDELKHKQAGWLEEGDRRRVDDELRIVNMDISDLQRHIDIVKEQIENGGELLAPFDAIVIGVYAQPGMMAGRMSPLFELCDTERGFIMRHEIPKEYAKFFSKAKVTPVGFVKSVPGTIISRAPGSEGGVEIVIELDPGKSVLHPNMLATFEVSDITEKFAALVPTTAIFDGSFVYKVIETEGPLGSEYRVKRTEVKIILISEGWAAVEGDIRGGDFGERVVVSSDRPLSDERVKVFQEE